RREEPGNRQRLKKVVPESGTQRGTGNGQRSEESCTGIRYAERNREQAASGRKLYRNPVRREEKGTGNERKKVVPESGTSGRIREQEAIGRKLYRNPVRREELGTGSDRKKVVPESGTQVGTGNGQRSEESCTGIRYVR
ncbi:hypothetical protein HMPREF0988_03189, partial [Lachnospiraceae bacterium 1_4_56FAA]